MKTGDKVLVNYGGQKVIAVIERCWANCALVTITERTTGIYRYDEMRPVTT